MTEKAPEPTWIRNEYVSNDKVWVKYVPLNRNMLETRMSLKLEKQIEQRARYKLLKEIADNCSWPFDTPSGEQSYEIVISRGEWELLMNKEQSGGGKE
jgi:hypothetical protein